MLGSFLMPQHTAPRVGHCSYCCNGICKQKNANHPNICFTFSPVFSIFCYRKSRIQIKSKKPSDQCLGHSKLGRPWGHFGMPQEKLVSSCHAVMLETALLLRCDLGRNLPVNNYCRLNPNFATDSSFPHPSDIPY